MFSNAEFWHLLYSSLCSFLKFCSAGTLSFSTISGWGYWICNGRAIGMSSTIIKYVTQPLSKVAIYIYTLSVFLAFSLQFYIFHLRKTSLVINTECLIPETMPQESFHACDVHSLLRTVWHSFVKLKTSLFSITYRMFIIIVWVQADFGSPRSWAFSEKRIFIFITWHFLCSHQSLFECSLFAAWWELYNLPWKFQQRNKRELRQRYTVHLLKNSLVLIQERSVDIFSGQFKYVMLFSLDYKQLLPLFIFSYFLIPVSSF